ncbi:MAG: Na/Pi cotransporter family protein [Eubacteriales bacterium]|nr:Na/Pi cotransporter family protein [Eubacteriales bacterium]
MDIFNILSMIGGLSLFLYGMSTMGNGLARMEGGKLESVLEKLTSKKIFAVLLGAGVTAVIQSSSATTVMVVGFVNSGIMKLSQAVGIIMGANVGTTITSWILSLAGIEGSTVWVKLLKPSSFSPVMALIGTILMMSDKGGSKKKDIGSILIGFAILMFGMETMSSAVSGLKNNPSFAGIMTSFSNPVLGMIAGAVITAVIQSSSASVGILQALCSTGAVCYSSALPIIMGQNIGTCITSIISSIGATKNAKRAAMIHLYFNLLGTILFMGIFYAINTFVDFAFLGLSANAAGIAIIHTLFNVLGVIVFYPFTGLLVKLSEMTIRDKVNDKELSKDEPAIDERFLEKPAFAMEICRKRVVEMAHVTEESINVALSDLMNYDEGKTEQVVKLESLVDRYEDVLGSYLVKLSGRNISKEDSRSMSVILHSLSDMERISDHALGISNAAKELHDKNLSFSEDAKKEISAVCEAVNDICYLTLKSFWKKDNEAALHVEPLEQVIDALISRIKENHITRLKAGKCSIEMGFILEDILIELERVADHCSNIALEMLTINENKLNMHEYYRDMSDSERDEFNTEYENLIKKYPVGPGHATM